MYAERRQETMSSTIASFAPDDVLYKSGKPSTSCILILTGMVRVTSSKGAETQDLGPYTLLGQELFAEDTGSFTPDFSAFLLSPEVMSVLRGHDTHMNTVVDIMMM